MIRRLAEAVRVQRSQLNPETYVVDRSVKAREREQWDAQGETSQFLGPDDKPSDLFGTSIEILPIDKIVSVDRMQHLRKSLSYDQEYIATLAQAMRDGTPVPPVTVKYVAWAKSLDLVSGRHRVIAAQDAGFTHMPAMILYWRDEAGGPDAWKMARESPSQNAGEDLDARLRSVGRAPILADRSHPDAVSPITFAAMFLAGVENGVDWDELDDDDRQYWEIDGRVPTIVAALARVGVTSIMSVLGRGSFGVAARTWNEHSGRSHVVKLTGDVAEVQVGAVLVGKRLPHVVAIYGAWHVRGIQVDAEVGWDKEREEALRKMSRVGILIEQLVDTKRLQGHAKQTLTRTVFDFKDETHNQFSDFTGLSPRAKREKLNGASLKLEDALRSKADRTAGSAEILIDAAEALNELRGYGVFAIDVHGNNIGWDEEDGNYRVFDVGVGSPPPDGPKPGTVGPASGPAKRQEHDKSGLAAVVGPPMTVGEI